VSRGEVPSDIIEMNKKIMNEIEAEEI
jgi:hypothetical protein